MQLFKPRSLYINLAFQLLIVWFFMFLYRLVFIINNSSFFPDFGLFDYAVGSWFDLITMSFFFLPFIIIGTVPLPKYLERYRRSSKLIFFIPSTVIIFFRFPTFQHNNTILLKKNKIECCELINFFLN